MEGAHETTEMAENVEHAAGRNKRIALLIAVLALVLALSEALGKSAQTEAVNSNIEASNLWAFYQAKTIRAAALRTAVETQSVYAKASSDPALKAELARQIAMWQETVARYDDQPDPPEGRKQLTARAHVAEQQRELALARYHQYEFSSAAFQIAIVLASASIITGAAVLLWMSAGLGVLGLALAALGMVAPQVAHIF